MFNPPYMPAASSRLLTAAPLSLQSAIQTDDGWAAKAELLTLIKDASKYVQLFRVILSFLSMFDLIQRQKNCMEVSYSV